MHKKLGHRSSLAFKDKEDFGLGSRLHHTRFLLDVLRGRNADAELGHRIDHVAAALEETGDFAPLFRGDGHAGLALGIALRRLADGLRALVATIGGLDGGDEFLGGVVTERRGQTTEDGETFGFDFGRKRVHLRTQGGEFAELGTDGV